MFPAANDHTSLHMLCGFSNKSAKLWSRKGLFYGNAKTKNEPKDHRRTDAFELMLLSLTI